MDDQDLQGSLRNLTSTQIYPSIEHNGDLMENDRMYDHIADITNIALYLVIMGFADADKLQVGRELSCNEHLPG
jgi:hypothetical protein